MAHINTDKKIKNCGHKDEDYDEDREANGPVPATPAGYEGLCFCFICNVTGPWLNCYWLLSVVCL